MKDNSRSLSTASISSRVGHVRTNTSDDALGSAVGVAVAVGVGVGVVVGIGVWVGVGIGVAAEPSSAATLLSSVVSLFSIAVNLSDTFVGGVVGWDEAGVGVGVAGSGDGALPPQTDKPSALRSLSSTSDRLAGTQPVRLLPLSRQRVRLVRLPSSDGMVPVRLLELRSRTCNADKFPNPAGMMPSRLLLGSDTWTTRPLPSVMPSHFSIERPVHQFSFPLPRRADFIPSRVSQSAARAALFAGTAPPVTQAELPWPVTIPTPIIVATITPMAINAFDFDTVRTPLRQGY